MLNRALSLVIICGMGLDGGQIRNGDHTWMVSKNTCYVLGKSNHSIADWKTKVNVSSWNEAIIYSFIYIA